MVAATRRVVLTGLGVLTPVGDSVEAYWDALRTGRSGIKAVDAFDAGALPARVAGTLPDFDAKKYIDKKDRKSLRVMARTIQLAVAAAQLALNDGMVDKTKLDLTRFGVEFGAGLIATELEELGDAALASCDGTVGRVDLEKWGTAGLAAITPLWMLKYLPNMLACHVSILHDAQGPNNSITEGDVAGLLAFGEAFRILARGDADLFLVGGAESKINPLSMVRQCLFEPMARHNDVPATACRPFDRRREGLVLGEGATVMVLEDLEHARRRGARIYAEALGFGASFDARKDGRGLARAARAALADAQVSPDDIDHVNAHGLGTAEADVWEAKALREVFGSRPVPVFAPKSYLGNLGAGSGPTELAASVLALRHGELPATLNYSEPDPACPVAVAARPRPVAKNCVLKVNFTPMGQCAAVVVRTWAE